MRRFERLDGSGDTEDYGDQNNPILVDHFPKRLRSDPITLTEFAQIKSLQELMVEVDAPRVESMVLDGYAYVCVTRQFEGKAFDKFSLSRWWSSLCNSPA